MATGTGGAPPKRQVGLLEGGTVGNPANIRLDDGVNTMWLVISENERCARHSRRPIRSTC